MDDDTNEKAGQQADAEPPNVLTESEKAILNRQLNGLPEGLEATNLLSYATTFDIVIIVVSVISSIIAGALNPLLTVLYGKIVGAFNSFSNGSISSSQLNHKIAEFNLYYVYLAIGIFVFIYITTVGFYHVGERIIRRLRYKYLETVIRQNIAFFDTLGAGDVTTRITSDMNLIQEGVTSKISLSLTAAATFSAAYVIAFIEYWKLALILTATPIVMLTVGTIGGKLAVKNSKESLKSYNGGANVAEEAIGSIRHVSASGIQNALANKYLAFLKKGELPGIKARISIAFLICFMNGLPFLSYGLSFWQGGRYLMAGKMSEEAVVTLTMAIVIGGFAIGRVAPNVQAFMSSTASAGIILRSMQRASPEDPLSSEGEKPEETRGELAFHNVKLVYPSREKVTVLKDVSFSMPAGKTTAIVGPTGSGKSSIVGLVERFYQPVGGHITLDGRNIQDLNLRWLRSQFAYVGQEPILFNATIFENICHGLAYKNPVPVGKELEQLVIGAARDANAHDFIDALPNGYDTMVGEKGLQLSGGQRQRIAIARALVRDPTLLILDEATSALDSRSERAVQKTLDAAAKGRTTIVIAHRLSTIRNADNIVVLSKGEIVEQGNHDSLMANQGLYASLVNKQQVVQEERAANRFAQEEDDDIGATIDSVQAIVQEKTSYVQSSAIKSKSQAADSVEAKEASKSRLSFWQLGRLIGKLNRAERTLMIVGMFGSILAGLGTPVQAIFFAKLIDALALPPSRYDELRSHTSFWALMYLMLGIVAILSWFGQGVCFAFSSERLIRRAKDTTFRSILRQEISYFDENSTGDLTTMLSQDTTHLAGLDGAVLGSIITFISTIIGGIVLSLIVGWKMALVCTATMPVTVGSGYLRLMVLSLFDRKVRQTQAESAAYASEAITAIRTVASLSLEDHILEHYRAIVDRDAAASFRSILQASALYAASQSLVMLCGSLAFWYGGTLVAKGEYSMLQLFICFSSLITGSQTAGAVFSFAPDMSKALHAGKHLKELFDRAPFIDNYATGGQWLEPCSGGIEIDNINFRYPKRPERLVLSNFSLSIKPGQFIALVGPSGCGKSTILALLERFFDPETGRIVVDGEDISKLNIGHYRSLIALVGQEPTVYSGTIRENILLGSPENVSEEAIVQACKDANIYDLIVSLPDGFSTVVGSRGNMLSGGQKQRLSIARALLRNPKILLLDEATSSLDSQSERLVQEALDKASQGRTTIAVAHRLSTIQKADVICVIDQGRLIEKGTHEQLMAKRQAYFELVQMQNLESYT